MKKKLIVGLVVVHAILQVALLGVMTGCSAYAKENAAIAAKNESRDSISLSLSVGGVTQTADLVSNEVKSMVIEIPVARPPGGYGGIGPSLLDRITDIQVSVFNKDAKVSSRTQICQAGAKVTTSIAYTNFPTDRGGYIQCQILNAYGVVVDPRTIDPTYSGVASKEQGGGSQ